MSSAIFIGIPLPGSGVYSDNKIDWGSYDYSFQGVSKECTATFSQP